jgi:guanylate kinase
VRPPECTTIFILPPSRNAEPLAGRSTDTDASSRRLADATDMSHCADSTTVVNDQFDQALQNAGHS